MNLCRTAADSHLRTFARSQSRYSPRLEKSRGVKAWLPRWLAFWLLG